MAADWKNIKEQRPALFDWLVFTISLLMGLIFPELKDLAGSASFPGWMLAALILYTAGLMLKHRPVYQRLATQGNTQNNVPFLLFLIIGHCLIMVLVAMSAAPAVRYIAGQPHLAANESSTGTVIISSTILALLITWLAFRPGGNSRKLLSQPTLFRRELVADILLISAVSILSFVFWEKSLVGAMEQMPLGNWGSIYMLFIFVCVSYILFYLPLRYLYLIEDSSSRETWKRLLLIFVLILLRGVFESMRH
jgi:hypothetical protein